MREIPRLDEPDPDGEIRPEVSSAAESYWVTSRYRDRDQQEEARLYDARHESIPDIPEVPSLGSLGLESFGEARELQSALTRVKDLNATVNEGLKDLWTGIELANVLYPIKESASESVSPEQEKALREAFAELPWVEQGNLHKVLRADGKVDLAGLERVYDANRAVFALRMADTRKAVSERDGVLSKAEQGLHGLSAEEREPYLSHQLDTLQIEASGQADQMPKQIRFERGEDAFDATLEGIVGAAAGLGIDPVVVIRVAVAFIPDSPTDIEIYLSDPPFKLD